MTTPLTLDSIRRAPKALLHDHLDGGLRPATVLELAATNGYDELPATGVDELATWFRTAAHSGSLVRYLEPFAHTVGVMQTPDALQRVAYECVEDLAADNVVYAEIRFAPELHIDRGLTLDAVVDAVLAGFADGEKAATAEGRGITVRCLVTAMRHAARSREIAELAIRFRDKGVVGFDIAGAEAGYPPTRHLDAFEYMRSNNARFTIHAGEAFGLRSRVTVNTDNRLMSDTTMSQEMLRLVEAFGYGWSDLERFTINAMKSAFIPFRERLAIIDGVIKPRYAVLVG